MGVNAAISQFVDKHHKVEITSTPTIIERTMFPNGDVGNIWNKQENEYKQENYEENDCCNNDEQ